MVHKYWMVYAVCLYSPSTYSGQLFTFTSPMIVLCVCSTTNHSICSLFTMVSYSCFLANQEAEVCPLEFVYTYLALYTRHVKTKQKIMNRITFLSHIHNQTIYPLRLLFKNIIVFKLQSISIIRRWMYHITSGPLCNKPMT